MSSDLALALMIGLGSLLAGLVLGRGLLNRRRDEKAKILAQDLTDKVHDRCDAYRRLEQRISGVIGELDEQQAAAAREIAVAQPAAQTTVQAPAAADALGWMEACQGVCPPAAVANAGVQRGAESQLDLVAERLRGAQDVNRTLIEAQNRTLEAIERRIASLEGAPFQPAPPPPPTRRPAAPEVDLRDLAEWSARIGAALAHLRAEGEHAAHSTSARCENCVRARELAQQIVDLRPSTPAPAEPRRTSVAPPPPVASRPRESYDLEQRLASKEHELESLRGALSRATQVIEGDRTKITHLMRSLEETQLKAEERRRLVQEQSSQISEAYSMLDRMRPLLRAIEGAAADEQHSALTPEYLEARGRG